MKKMKKKKKKEKKEKKRKKTSLKKNKFEKIQPDPVIFVILSDFCVSFCLPVIKSDFTPVHLLPPQNTFTETHFCFFRFQMKKKK
jgi:hypothetical protein